MQTDLLIIGAGPAGLCHAFWRLQQDPDLDVRIVDRAPQPGGWVQTRRTEGYSCETGPQAFRPCDASDTLIKALEMESRVVPCNDAAKLRFIARGGALHPLPNCGGSHPVHPFGRRGLPVEVTAVAKMGDAN